MKNPPFTPGPWSLGFHDPLPADGVERKGTAFVNAGATCVAKTDGLLYLSNANLIVAAPELFVALERAAVALGGMSQRQPITRAKLDEIIALADAALLKAGWTK